VILKSAVSGIELALVHQDHLIHDPLEHLRKTQAQLFHWPSVRSNCATDYDFPEEWIGRERLFPSELIRRSD